MKQDLTICHLPKTCILHIMTQTSRKGKNGKKIHNVITKHKKLSMSTLLSDTVNFKTNSITRDREISHNNDKMFNASGRYKYLIYECA